MTRLASPDSISQHALRRSEPSGAELTVVLKPDAPKIRRKCQIPA